MQGKAIANRTKGRKSQEGQGSSKPIKWRTRPRHGLMWSRVWKRMNWRQPIRQVSKWIRSNRFNRNVWFKGAESMGQVDKKGVEGLRILYNWLVRIFQTNEGQEHGQSHEEFLSDQKAGQEHLCILGVQDAPVSTRPRISRLYWRCKRSNSRVDDQRFPGLGEGIKRYLVVLGI